MRRRWPSRSPELIVTQAVCEVCAVSYDDVVAVAERLPSRPQVISLDPTTIGEVLADVPRLAEAAGVAEEGEQLVEVAAERLDDVRDAVISADPVPVAALEWLDPVFVGGHWVPQMIEMAGGHRRDGPGRREVPHRRVGRAGGHRAPGGRVDALRLRHRAGRPRDARPRRTACRARRPGRRGGRLGLLLAARAAAGGRRGADGPPAAPRAGARAAAGRFAWLDLDRSGSPA